MHDSQLETTPFQSCLEVSYVLRICPPSHIHEADIVFDQMICSTLESIVGNHCQIGHGSRPLILVIMEPLGFAVPGYTHPLPL